MIKILIVISLYSFLSSCSPSGDIYDTDDNHDVKDEYSQNGQDNDAEDEDSDSETTDSERMETAMTCLCLSCFRNLNF